MQNVLLSDIIDYSTFKNNKTPVWQDGKHFIVHKIIDKDNVELVRDLNEQERSQSKDNRIKDGSSLREKITCQAKDCVVKNAAEFLKINKYEDSDYERDKEGFRQVYEIIEQNLCEYIRSITKDDE